MRNFTQAMLAVTACAALTATKADAQEKMQRPVWSGAYAVTPGAGYRGYSRTPPIPPMYGQAYGYTGYGSLYSRYGQGWLNWGGDFTGYGWNNYGWGDNNYSLYQNAGYAY